MNAGHLLGAEEHGSSFGGIKNEVVMRGLTTKLVNSTVSRHSTGRWKTACSGHRALCRWRIGGL